MGACSTINVTEKAVRRFLVDHILYNASSAELEDLADTLLRSRCYNVRIVEEDERNDNYVLRTDY